MWRYLSSTVNSRNSGLIFLILLTNQFLTYLKKYRDKEFTSPGDLLRSIKNSIKIGYEPVIFPDAEEYINRKISLEKMANIVNEIRKDPKNHPLRKNLLKVELLPYQLEGIAFVASTGRAVLADDMGLGKTIQAIGAAELLSRYCGISKVLIICPTSLKSQCAERSDGSATEHHNRSLEVHLNGKSNTTMKAFSQSVITSRY